MPVGKRENQLHVLGISGQINNPNKLSITTQSLNLTFCQIRAFLYSKLCFNSNMTLELQTKETQMEITLETVCKELKDGMQMHDRKIDAHSLALNEKIESQGIALTEKIEAQGHALHEKVEAQGHALNEKIEEQGHALNEKVEAQGHALTEKIEAQSRWLDSRFESKDDQRYRLETKISTLQALVITTLSTTVAALIAVTFSLLKLFSG